MKLIRRQIELIKYFNDHANANIKGLAEIMDVAAKTLKSDVKYLQPLFKEYGMDIEILSSNDIFVHNDENMIRLLKDSELMLSFPLEKQIMLALLLNEDFVVMQDLADQLFVSKSLLEKVMAVLLKKYSDSLQSVRHKGVRCIASAQERRGYFASILSPYMQGANFQFEVKDVHDNHFPIMDYVRANELTSAIHAIENIYDNRTFVCTDESICQLFLQVLFTKYSHRAFKIVNIGTAFEDIVKNNDEAGNFLSVADSLCKYLDIDSMNERYYMCYLLMSLRKQEIFDNDNFIEEMEPVINEIFNQINDQFAIDLSLDSILAKGLSVHLYTTVLRKDAIIDVPSEYNWHDIKHQYPLGFEMAAITARIVFDKYSYKVSDNELIYLTLHFQAALERLKAGEQNIRVLIVCHYGMAAANLIATKLQRIFRSVEIVDAISVQKFRMMDHVQADLVVCTESLQRRDIPMILVTPVLSEYELKQIKNFIETRSISNMLSLSILNSLVLDLEAGTKEEALEDAVEYLEQNGIARQGYLQSILERERISSTDVDCIAVPHGNPDFVNQTRLLVVRLKKPVDWGISKVSYIFMFAVAKEQFMHNFTLFTTFYKKLVLSNVKNELPKLINEDANELKHKLAILLNF